MSYQDPGKRNFFHSRKKKTYLVVLCFSRKMIEEDSARNDKPF